MDTSEKIEAAFSGKIGLSTHREWAEHLNRFIKEAYWAKLFDAMLGFRPLKDHMCIDGARFREPETPEMFTNPHCLQLTKIQEVLIKEIRPLLWEGKKREIFVTRKGVLFSVDSEYTTGWSHQIQSVYTYRIRLLDLVYELETFFAEKSIVEPNPGENRAMHKTCHLGETIERAICFVAGQSVLERQRRLAKMQENTERMNEIFMRVATDSHVRGLHRSFDERVDDRANP